MKYFEAACFKMNYDDELNETIKWSVINYY